MKRVIVRRSSVHGKGVFALRQLAAGERVLQYKGEIMSWRDAVRRHEHEGTIATPRRNRFIVRLRRDARRDFMHERHALHACSHRIEQMHNISAGDKKTLRIAELEQPIGH